MWLNCQKPRGLGSTCFRRYKSRGPKLERSTQNVREDSLKLSRFTTIREDYQMPQNPIVLCHGFSGFDSLIALPTVQLFHWAQKSPTTTQHIAQEATTKIEVFEYWHGIRRELLSRGCRVLAAKVPPFATIETRSEILNKFIQQKVEARFPNASEPVKVNLIAHSMGGLDCRYLISAFEQRNFQVVSLTTVSTPHRGSYAANRIIELFPFKVIDTVFPSIRELTLENCARLNKEIQDDPNVKYFSYGASFKPNIFNVFYPTWKMVYPKEGPNDGLVSLESAQWGDYLGHMENVDHLDLINWMNLSKRVKNLAGIGTFNPIALYLDIADNLAKQGL